MHPRQGLCAIVCFSRVPLYVLTPTAARAQVFPGAFPTAPRYELSLALLPTVTVV